MHRHKMKSLQTIGPLLTGFLVLSLGVIEGCQVKSERCSFPFQHGGESHSSCIELTPSENEVNATDKKYYCKIENTEKDMYGLCNSGCRDDEENPMKFKDGDSISVFCKNEAEPCVFPFTHEGVEYKSCISNDGNNPGWCATEVDADGNVVDGRWGMCSSDCAPPLILTVSVDDVDGGGGGGPEYENDDKKETEEEVSPDTPEIDDLPTEVSDAPEVIIITDEPTKAASTGDAEKISIKVMINSGEIDGELLFGQKNPESEVSITGTIAGLPPGHHGFHVHEVPDLGDNCKNAGMHFNPTKSVHGSLSSPNRHLGDFGNIIADENGVAFISIDAAGITLYEGDNSILGLPIVIHELQDDLGDTENNTESTRTGNSGARLACALIKEEVIMEEEEDNTLLIIIIVIIVIIIILVIITVIICYCIKKRRSKIREKVPYDDPGLDYPNGDACKKSPLYDELSIPFIDASPAPTPKTGRSTERLSFFNRTPSIGRSRGSLSMPPPYAPPPPPSIQSSTTEISWRGSNQLSNRKPAKV